MFVLSLFLWRSSRGILVVFFEAAGVSHDNPGAQTCTFEGPRIQKHHQNSTRRPPEREREKERKWVREREKKSEILGGPAEGGPAKWRSRGKVVRTTQTTPPHTNWIFNRKSEPHTTHTTHTHTHHTHTHTHTHTHHTQHTQQQTHTPTHTRQCTHTNTHTPTQQHTHQTHTRQCTHTNPHTPTPTHTPTHTHQQHATTKQQPSQPRVVSNSVWA